MPTNLLRWISILGLLAVNAPSSVACRTILVPEEIFPLYAAIDSAVAGDTVSVAPGVYAERSTRTVILPDGGTRLVSAVAFLKEGVHVVSRAGPETTALSGTAPGAGRTHTVVLANQGPAESSLVGFSLVENGPFGVALRCVDIHGFVVQDCVFERNSQGGPSVLLAEVFDNVRVVDCVFRDNGVALIAAFGDGDAVIEGCEFSDNIGAAVAIGTEGSLSVSHSRFLRNDSSPEGGAGVLVYGSPVRMDVEIRHCEFIENRTEGGNGAAVRLFECQAVVEFCTFVRNSSQGGFGGRGGGIYASSLTGPSMVRNCTFFECSAELEGAVLTAVLADLDLSNNAVVGSQGGAAVSGFDGSESGDCNLYWGNEGGNYANWNEGPRDVFLAPQFCDAPGLEFTLQGSSPAAPENAGDCSLIGAFGVGCEPVSVEPQTWSRTKALYR